ncbi:MarC family protein [Telmatospirillum sp.]|uniref:MarC family protein n=1 Tax=Telmatospirillum sp. TaxID=2079197 RepID=UPI002846E8A1|nr:MarC family protein [Telmatospirillum sp.]MDR3440153.1 MarC family protein [Telmatospirillum sp.]
MVQILAAYLAVVAGLFPIVNPLGMAPIFLRLTTGSSDKVRAALAWRVAVGGLALMSASLFVGSYILAFFGLTVAAVQVAGGLVVIMSGWRLLQQGDDSKTREQQSFVSEDVLLTRAFYPLTMPLTVGPGAISVAITLGAKGAGSGNLLFEAIGAMLGVVTVAGTIYLSYRFAYRLLALLGQGGRDVFLRLSAFILLCLGVQIVWNGISALTGLPSS